jgi:hypothetical protein
LNTEFLTERAVLGALLEDPTQIPDTFNRLPPGEWTGPHVLIAEALQAMSDAREPIEPATLLNKMLGLGTLTRVGGGAEIFTLVESRANYASMEHLLQGLEEVVLRRQAGYVATRFGQRLDNPTIPPDEAISATVDELQQLSVVTGSIDDEDGWPVGERDPEPEWVIPFLLAKDDRVMLTGSEGHGKTELCRQLVASVAVGRHPWTFEEIEPGPVLHVDLENPRYISDSRYRWMRNSLQRAGVGLLPDHLYRWAPRQWDILNPADVAALMRKVRRIQPQLIAIGPAKNMSSMSLNDDEAASALTHTLNRIRAETRAALVVEHHAAHSSEDWRPRGNRLFMGWPEFGLGLHPIHNPGGLRAAELKHWRGDRAPDRHWPRHLVSGTPWPWVEDPRGER